MKPTKINKQIINFLAELLILLWLLCTDPFMNRCIFDKRHYRYML